LLISIGDIDGLAVGNLVDPIVFADGVPDRFADGVVDGVDEGVQRWNSTWFRRWRIR
jgi:hypothetical protein